jgi:hypothetical protein
MWWLGEGHRVRIRCETGWREWYDNDNNNKCNNHRELNKCNNHHEQHEAAETIVLGELSKIVVIHMHFRATHMMVPFRVRASGGRVGKEASILMITIVVDIEA